MKKTPAAFLIDVKELEKATVRELNAARRPYGTSFAAMIRVALNEWAYAQPALKKTGLKKTAAKTATKKTKKAKK